ncbi:Voltage-dependent T-type calcium channel subunit alpha-1I [Bagarius yarrelli]|uniref:Voltage-dependent T-type calcium channel subunit alpha-1I n=1 Tax=Bagarius yarrelli TaxID=175774 RepID=A0A556VB47_BAGYA|nr:Voltage-dependent T-type calcium channel subunit alpha-1I [Bagarius yarrelli]
MVLKMVALGVFGPRCYLGDTWNRLDLFIVMAGGGMKGHHIQACPEKNTAKNKKKNTTGMRILVTLLLDTLPMLGNVLLLCFFVFFIFGIVGVQLWAGLLRNRCFLDDDARIPDDSDDIAFICSTNRENGMLRCSDVPPRKVGGAYCANATGAAPLESTHRGCVNWNAYYNNCRASEHNPHNGAINFDNIGYAWIAIFQVITLEGWVDIMYYVMDAHSFYNFIYFIFLIIVGSFFMINLCLVVIATQFSETKQRENQLMREQRARFRSNESTLTSLAEPGSCYEEILNYLAHLLRKFYRYVVYLYNVCRKSKSANLGESSVGGANGHWSNNEKIELTRHLFPPHSVGYGSDVPDVKAGLLRGDKCLPTYASSFPLTVHSLKGIGVNYPTILPLAFFTHSRVHPGCSTGLKSKNSKVKTQHGVYSGVCSNVCAEAGGRSTPCDSPTCPVPAHTADTLSSASDCESDSEKESVTSVTEVKRASWDSVRKPKRENVLRVCVRCVRAVLRRIVDSKYFNRGIMIAILINTLSMGVEYHEQPAELTDVLEISNIVFTSLFALEMVLKLLACGLLGYISNPYNIFDLIIVIIRHDVWELIGQADGGLSVLRTFRLLRVLKLVRFLPALRRQLVVLMKTMDNVATFCMLLMLFIFIFRCFTLRLENGDTVSDRKNFDSLLWAIVTVFQVGITSPRCSLSVCQRREDTETGTV